MRTSDAYLLDILTEARKLVDRFRDVPMDEFYVDEEKQYVAFWSISIIGEAAGHVPERFRIDHSEIPWAEMIAFRNILIHNYVRINLNRVWRVINESAPALIEALAPIIDQSESSQ